MTRIAVDATAVPARLTGAGVYVARVLAELATRNDLEMEVFCAPGSAGVPGPSTVDGNTGCGERNI